MSHHNTLNTRLLPLSILISSLVSTGAVAVQPINPPDLTPPVSTGPTSGFMPGATLGIGNAGSFLVTDSSVVDAPEEKSIFEKLSDYLTAGFITPEQKDKWQENLEKLDEKKAAATDAQAAADLATEANKKAIQNVADVEKLKAAVDTEVNAKEAAIQLLAGTLSKKNDVKKDAITAVGLTPTDAGIATQVTDRVTKSEKELEEKNNVLIDKTTAADAAADAKKQHEAEIKKFDEQLAKLDKELSEANDNKTDVLAVAVEGAKQAKSDAEANTQSELGKALAEHNKTKVDLNSQDNQTKNKAIENQTAYNKLAKNFEDAIAAAEKAVVDKDAEIKKLGLDKSSIAGDKSTAENNTAQIKDAATKATEAKTDAQNAATAAHEAVTQALAAADAIKAAEAAQHAVAEAQAEKQKLTEQLALIMVDIPKAEQAKRDADTDLTAKSNELATAQKAVKDLVDNTPATELPAVDKTIAQGNSDTVAAETLTINTQVAGGTQNVEKDGKIIGSIISEDGTLNLAIGALAHDTVVNKGIINNNGGTDHDSVIHDGGKLILAGTTTQDANGKDVINAAKSYDAKILEGGIATVGKFAEIHNLSSTKGTVELQDGAKAFNTAIDGGTLTIEKGANAQSTSLTNANLDLIEGAIANSTVVGEGAKFTLKDKAKTTATQLTADDSQFILEKGSLATATYVENGTMTVNGGANANEVNVSGEGTLILKSGATVENAHISDRATTFTLESGATATDTLLDFAELELVKGATADATKLTSGSVFTLQEGATTTGTLIDSNSQFIVNDNATASNTTLNSGEFIVAGTANNTTLNDGEFIVNGTANNTTLNSGEFIVAGTANNTTVTGGKFALNQGATANTTTLSNGDFIVAGTAKDTTVTGGKFAVNQGAMANTTTLSNGDFIVAGIANNTTVTGGKFALNQGATANTTTLNSGEFIVNGTAKDTTVTGGKFALNQGATANTTILNNGEFIVDGIANNTTVKGGKFALNQNATANTTILNNGEFIVAGTAKDTTVTGGKFALNQGATANTTILNNGEFIVDGIANNTTVKGGKFALNQNATANTTILNNGEFIVAGTANNTTLNDGEFIVAGTANNTAVKGGKFDLMARAQAHKLVVENGSALISGHLVDAAFKGGTAIFDKNANIGGTVIFDKAANIGGTINANKNSILNLYSGAATQDADLNLAGNLQLFTADAPLATAHLTSRAAFAGSNGKPAQFAFKNVKLAGGNIDMSQSAAQLTMASLAGNGSFNLGSTQVNHASAPLNITGNADGTFAIQINNSGVTPANLDVVAVQGKNTAKFALSNGPVELGNYKHSLVSDGKGGFKLAADKTALTPGTAGIMAIANTMPVIFNAELSSIQNRLDKQTTAANESGVWLTYLNDSYDVKGTAANFNQKLNGITLGGDKAIELGDAVLSMGGFASHTSSNIKSDYQSSGSVESNSLGAYAQLLSTNGYYFNSVLKTNQFKQNLSVTSQGNSATGAANFSGLGIALKAGKHINVDAMYVSPYVALNTFSSGKNQYKLSNGMQAQSQGTRSTTGTLGMNTGYRFVLNSGAEIKPYAIFSVDHDLMASNKVMINNEMFNNNLKGTRANAGVGINVNLTSNLSIGSEVKVSKGKNIATPMTINMGVAYTF